MRHDCRMDRATALELLRRSKPELQRRFGVVRLVLFGSMARDQSRPESDADVLVAFDGPADSRRYFGLQLRPQRLLGHQVDRTAQQVFEVELKTEVATRIGGAGRPVRRPVARRCV